MSRFSRALGLALALAIFAGVIFILYYGFTSWPGATDTVKAATIVAIVSVLTFAATKYFEQKEIYRQRIVKEKTDCYLGVINLIFDVLKPKQIRQGPEIADSELADKLFEVQKDMMIWGSDQVISSWISFRRHTEEFAEKDTKDLAALATVLHSTGRLILSIRKDIGYSGTTLTEADIAGLILKFDDPDNRAILEELKNQ